jgi:CRISPR-associated protein Cas2
VYDVEVERINQVRALMKQYLNWVQNSAFEGELTAGKLEEVSAKLSDIIDQERDSIIFYTLSNPNWIQKRIIGIEKSEVSTVL